MRYFIIQIVIYYFCQSLDKKDSVFENFFCVYSEIEAATFISCQFLLAL